MIPSDHQNLFSKTHPIQQEQNYAFAPETPDQYGLRKLDLEWKKKMEKLFNNTDDEDDYFHLHSDASNTSISTICLNSNESLLNDSCCSETDATHRDDIVIQLTERAFYNVKVNPFPKLNFPPHSFSDKCLPNIDYNQSKKDFAPENVKKDNQYEDEENNLSSDANDVQTYKNQSNPSRKSITFAADDVQTYKNLSDSSRKSSLVPVDDAQTAKNQSVSSQKSSIVPADDAETYKNLSDSSQKSRTASVDDAKNLSVSSQKSSIVPVDDAQSHKNQSGSSRKSTVSKFVDEKAEDLASIDVKNDDNGNQLQENDLHSEVSGAETNVTEVESSRIGRKCRATRLAQSLRSYANEDKNVDNVKKTTSDPLPVVSSSVADSLSLEERKKQFRSKNRSNVKCADSDSEMTVMREYSKSSDCTKITSTTTVQVTTNDEEIFEALEDMPNYMNTSVIDLASSYVDERLKLKNKKRTRCIDFDRVSGSSSLTSSWQGGSVSSPYDDCISPHEAYKRLDTLLTDGTNENRNAVMYDEYSNIRFDNDIASSEEEFLSDLDDLDVTDHRWTPPQSELRRQVGKILDKLHPLENGYSSIVDDMLRKYLHYINNKQRIAKINRIVSCVSKSITQQAKTELLIEREIEDKKLNRKFYCSAQEPIEFTELGERRREAIIEKYTKCHNDRIFCHNYFKRSIEDRPISKLDWKVAKLKKEFGLIFA